MSETLGNRLREERSSRQLTQAQLADMVGVSRRTINSVENSVFVPSTLLSLRLARVLQITVDDLFFIEDAKE